MDYGRFVLTVVDIPDIERGVGLAVVLETPGGRTWLYDAGTGYPDGQGGWIGDVNTGRDQIAPFLERKGIRNIDGVVISHAHYDHFGGLFWLLDHLPPAQLVDCGYVFEGDIDAHYARELADYADLRERFRRQGGDYRAVQAGDRLDIDPALDVEVIAPPSGFFCEQRPENRPPNDPPAHYLLNANSVMLRIRHGRLVFLLPGDIEHEDQVRYLLPSVPADKLGCDVLVAPGHGLHAAPEFADAAQPKVTIASCFRRWSAPGACKARKVFAERGSEVFVTGLHGDVTVTSDGERFQVTTRKPGHRPLP